MAGYEALPIVISHLSALVRKLHLYTRIAEQAGPYENRGYVLGFLKEKKISMQKISLANKSCSQFYWKNADLSAPNSQFKHALVPATQNINGIII